MAIGRSACRSAKRSTAGGCGLISSQVGAVASAQRSRWSHRRRLTLALDLLADPRFEALLAPAAPFARLPELMAELAARPSNVMCQLIKYL